MAAPARDRHAAVPADVGEHPQPPVPGTYHQQRLPQQIDRPVIARRRGPPRRGRCRPIPCGTDRRLRAPGTPARCRSRPASPTPAGETGRDRRATPPGRSLRNPPPVRIRLPSCPPLPPCPAAPAGRRSETRFHKTIPRRLRPPGPADRGDSTGAPRPGGSPGVAPGGLPCRRWRTIAPAAHFSGSAAYAPGARATAAAPARAGGSRVSSQSVLRSGTDLNRSAVYGW